MSNSINSLCELKLKNEINKILPNAYNYIEDISSLPAEIASKIFLILIEYACLSQNIDLIISARYNISKIPSDWIVKQLPKVSKKIICFDDEWEYRRLLELISEISLELLKWAIAEGYNSQNEEVKEAAEDFEVKFIKKE